ncbi:MAG: hypothetical protein VX835_04070 [Pseudomonadota bacterium]|nr:hypothetical protein [Pseudomonadota bacterium]
MPQSEAFDLASQSSPTGFDPIFPEKRLYAICSGFSCISSLVSKESRLIVAMLELDKAIAMTLFL